MITFAQIKQLFAFETQGKYCVEILFSVHESKKFDCCWMGKLHDKKIGHDVYWFGLTSDGKNAFDYPTFEEFSNAKVFDGKSLIEIWDTVTVEEIDGCHPTERLRDYIGENNDQRTYARTYLPCRKVGGRNERRSAGRSGLA